MCLPKNWQKDPWVIQVRSILSTHSPEEQKKLLKEAIESNEAKVAYWKAFPIDNDPKFKSGEIIIRDKLISQFQGETEVFKALLIEVERPAVSN